MLKRTLPDVTSDQEAESPSTLQWVGMDNIAVPVAIRGEKMSPQTVAAKASVYVSLETPEVKGIHMSRLYTIVNRLAEQDCRREAIDQLLKDLINSQSGIGRQAKVALSFDVLLKKNALVSHETGYQSYPITIISMRNAAGLSCEFELTIPYSSTCPCSASLARQLYSDQLSSRFSGSKIEKAELLEWIQSPRNPIPTPHSQRSYAYIHLALGDNDWPDITSLIFQLEEVIGTPVQTAVKRIDEQEFARLNAENMMFCEDAARRIKYALDHMAFAENYRFKVEHQESLHAHNAVVIDQKYFDGEFA